MHTDKDRSVQISQDYMIYFLTFTHCLSRVIEKLRRRTHEATFVRFESVTPSNLSNLFNSI